MVARRQTPGPAESAGLILPALVTDAAGALIAPPVAGVSPAPLAPDTYDLEERAAILEYDAGYARVDAERLARQMTGKMDMSATPTPAVYAAISKAQAALAAAGISKDRRNEQQGYAFRGIDQVYNALSTVLVEAGLVVVPRMLHREVIERQTAKGGVLFYVTLQAAFDVIAVKDGSTVTVATYGEAMDSGDKATNKAMSAAYKYAMFQLFCIPTEAQDADAQTHEVAPLPAPDGYAEWMVDLSATADLGTEPLKQAWTKSKPAYRQHLTATHPDTWAALKARAARVA